MEAQQSISLARNERLVGQRIKVMIESFDEQKGWYYGRSQWDAPRIDNTVYTEAEGVDYNCLGEFVEFEITSCKPYDLYGKAVLSSVAGATAEASLATVR